MKNNRWVKFALLLIIPSLLLTVSCAKKTVAPGETQMTAAEQEAARLAAEQAEAEALARQRAIEESRLTAEQAEALKREAAAEREKFEIEDIHFSFDSSDLSEKAQDLLTRKAGWLMRNPEANIVIEGHCDERGTTEYNLALGERRADAARTFLVDSGIQATRVTTVSYGEERPLDPGRNEAAWARNRRAHFVIK